MSYLDRLNGLNEKYSPMEGTAKTAKIDLRGFCSSHVAQKNLIHSAMTSYRWLIHFFDRDPLEVAFSPEASHTDVLDFYPEALAAEAWPNQEERVLPGQFGLRVMRTQACL